MKRIVSRLLAVMLGLGIVACSLTIDEEKLGGERILACTSKEKECDVEGVPECVSLKDASFGCSRPNCIPCNLPNATAICSPATGDCVVGACHGTWFDCNRLNSDGCEVNVADNVDHCGACLAACPARPHAEVRCGGTHCYIRVCDRGHGDCNDDFDDGCEIDLRTNVDHCGACDTPCDGVCKDGTCSAK